MLKINNLDISLEGLILGLSSLYCYVCDYYFFCLLGLILNYIIFLGFDFKPKFSSYWFWHLLGLVLSLKLFDFPFYSLFSWFSFSYLFFDIFFFIVRIILGNFFFIFIKLYFEPTFSSLGLVLSQRFSFLILYKLIFVIRLDFKPNISFLGLVLSLSFQFLFCFNYLISYLIYSLKLHAFHRLKFSFLWLHAFHFIWREAMKETCLVRDGMQRQLAFIYLYNIVKQCKSHVWSKVQGK